MEECKHEHIDMSNPIGNGYVRCMDCGKSIPVERALAAIETRLRRLERFMELKIMEKEAKDEGR